MVHTSRCAAEASQHTWVELFPQPHDGLGFKKAVANDKCDLMVISGRTMSMLQSIDVSLNKNFKDRIKALCNKQMKVEDKPETTDCVKHPYLNTVAQWVSDAWYGPPADMVRDAFIKCSVTALLHPTTSDDGSNDSNKQA